MADSVIYEIKYSTGLDKAAIPENAVNTTATSLTLYGRGATEYGQGLQQNLVYMLENFANSTAPKYPMAGQLWYNISYDVLHVYNGTGWIALVGTDGTDLSLLQSGQIPVVDTDKRLRYRTLYGDVTIASDGLASIIANTDFTFTGDVTGFITQIGKANVTIPMTIAPNAVDLTHFDYDVREHEVSGTLSNISTGNKRFIMLRVPYDIIVREVILYTETGTATTINLRYNNTAGDGDVMSLKTYTPFWTTSVNPDELRVVSPNQNVAADQGISLDFANVTGTIDELHYTIVYERM